MTLIVTALSQKLWRRHKWAFFDSMTGLYPGAIVGLGDPEKRYELVQVAKDWNGMYPVPLIRGIGRTKKQRHKPGSRIVFESELSAQVS